MYELYLVGQDKGDKNRREIDVQGWTVWQQNYLAHREEQGQGHHLRHHVPASVKQDSRTPIGSEMQCTTKIKIKIKIVIP